MQDVESIASGEKDGGSQEGLRSGGDDTEELGEGILSEILRSEGK